MKAKCPRCDFSMDYIPNSYNYVYEGCGITFKYPIIRYGWCNGCKCFVPVQMGIDHKNIKQEEEQITQQLKHEERKILFKSKEKIKKLHSELSNYETLNNITKKRSTDTTCIKCGGNDVVFKDIEHQIWQCPKCKKSFLILQKDKDNNILCRKQDKVISPSLRINGIEIFCLRILMCTIDINNNQQIKCIQTNDIKSLIAQTNPIDFINKIALVYNYIHHFYDIKTEEMLFIKSITKLLSENGLIKEEEIKGKQELLQNRIKYFNEEFEVEKECEHFIPSAMVKTLNNPDKQPTHEIVGIDIFKALEEWKIISDTISAYWSHLKSNYYYEDPFTNL